MKYSRAYVVYLVATNKKKGGLGRPCNEETKLIIKNGTRTNSGRQQIFGQTKKIIK